MKNKNTMMATVENQQAPGVVIVEQIIAAPVSRVWEALTVKEKMKLWYFDLNAFEARVGFTFRFPGKGSKGEEYMHFCQITEVIVNRKLQYTWRYEHLPGASLVTFDLLQDGTSTRIRVTHTGLDTFPQGHPDFADNSFLQGWTELITVQLPKFIQH